MKVTNIQVYPAVDAKEGDRERATVRVVLDDALQLTQMKIYEGRRGPFLAYPVQEESGAQLFYPISRELRNHIELEALYEFCFHPMFTGPASPSFEALGARAYERTLEDLIKLMFVFEEDNKMLHDIIHMRLERLQGR